ncbi:NAD(P)/FAD-dependent oxidoreductase [Stackebrandtia soli]|uniref:NAD(P)/FAD-dependent oxidoreductase n=1 Tax=Stackebrandtia soli TaxID=1892856 RepID=UPI0039E8CB20
MTATVVVVGGGYGGIAVAQSLDADADVVLIDPKDAFVHNVAALRAVVDPTWADQMFFPYETLLKNGRVVRDWVVSVDRWGVRLASGVSINADYIVLATGTTYSFPAKVDELQSSAAKMRYHVLTQALYGSGRVLLLGGGPVGVELAGEIKTMWPDKDVTILEPAADILSRSFVKGFKRDLAANMRAELHRQLEAMGVQVILGSSLSHQLPTVAGEARTFTATTWGGRKITADIWFRCFGRQPASGMLSSGISKARRPDGYLSVTNELRLPRQETIFSIGDVAATDGIDSAVVAMEQAEVVANNIRALINDKSAALQSYEATQPIFLVPLGPKGGVSYSPDVGLLDAETTAMYKGNDLFTGKYREIFGLTD